MIVFVQERPIEILPPVISLLKVLKDLGEDVVYFGMVKTETSICILEEIGVRYELYPYELICFRDHPVRRCWQKVTRRIRPYLLRSWIWKRIRCLSGKAIRFSNSLLMLRAVWGEKKLKFQDFVFPECR